MSTLNPSQIKTIIKKFPRVLDRRSEQFIADVATRLKERIGTITATHNNSFGSILFYNSNIKTVEECIEHLYKCYTRDNKVGGEYLLFMFGETGLKEFRDYKRKNRLHNIKQRVSTDLEYVKSKHASTIKKIDGITQDVDFIARVITEHIPMNDLVRDAIVSVLTINRFETLEELQSNLREVIAYEGSRNHLVDEYGILLYGEEAHFERKNKHVNNQREQLIKINKAKALDINTYISSAHTMIKTFKVSNCDPTIAGEIMFESPMELGNELHKRWLADLFIHQSHLTKEQMIERMDKIINFKGNRLHGYEWECLRYGKDRADELIKIKSDKISGDKNFFHDHQGAYSLWSDNTVIDTSKYNLVEIKNVMSSKRKVDPRNVFIRAHYNTDEDYLYHQRKDLSFYIDKYGEEEGFDRYRKKKMIWHFSRYKGYNSNVAEMLDTYGNDNCVMYVLDLGNSVIKFGVTINSIAIRYNRPGAPYKVLKEYKSTLAKCLDTELLIKRKFNSYTIDPNHKIGYFGVTESLYADCLPDVIELIDSKLN